MSPWKRAAGAACALTDGDGNEAVTGETSDSFTLARGANYLSA